MLIWDTGEYEVVPKQELKGDPGTSGSESEASEKPELLSETQKLQQAFRNVRPTNDITFCYEY